MLKEKLQLLKRLHIVCDVILTIAAYFIAEILAHVLRTGYFPKLAELPITTSDLVIVAIVWAFLIVNQNDPYAYRTKAYRDIFKSVMALVIKGVSGYFILLFAIKSQFPGRLFVMFFLAVDFILLFLLRVLVAGFLHIIRSQGRNCQQILVVGDGSEAREIINDIVDNPKWGIRIRGVLSCRAERALWRYRDIPLVGLLADLPQLIQNNQIDYVVFAVDRQRLDQIDQSIKICEEMGVKTCLLADFFKTSIATKQIGEFLFRPAIIYSTVPDLRLAVFVKSLIDRAGALAALIMTSPILLILGFVVKLTSSGKVLFAQERCGLNGRRFKLYKFRTMVEGAETMKPRLMSTNEMDGPAFKIRNDPRITQVGGFLRRTSLDELPQLLNIIKGEMSFVGPRPPLPEEVKRYDLWQRRKLSVKPGLTCLWQVGRRNESSFEEWMKLDLKYIDNWSLWLDTKILLKTIPTILNATGR